MAACAWRPVIRACHLSLAVLPSMPTLLEGGAGCPFRLDRPSGRPDRSSASRRGDAHPRSHTSPPNGGCNRWRSAWPNSSREAAGFNPQLTIIHPANRTSDRTHLQFPNGCATVHVDTLTTCSVSIQHSALPTQDPKSIKAKTIKKTRSPPTRKSPRSEFFPENDQDAHPNQPTLPLASGTAAAAAAAGREASARPR